MFKKLFSGLNAGKESVDELYDEIEVLREECSSLNEVIKNKDVKIDKLFKEIDDLKNQLTERSASERIDQNLLDRLDTEIKNRDQKIKKLENENTLITKKLVLDIDEERIDDILKPELFNYKILISDYYEARKFESFKKVCEENKFVYVEDLKTFDFSSLPLTDTKIKNAKLHFEEYSNGYFDLDLKTYLLKGEKISKVFFRFRSFVKYCKRNNFNYMIELDILDFNTLLEDNFTRDQIEKLKNKLKRYNDLKRI